MGQGIDLAKDMSPEDCELLEDLRDALLVGFVNRLGGDVSLTAEEIDEVGSYTLAFSLEDRTFNFVTNRKN